MRLAPVPIRYVTLFPDRMTEPVKRAVESSLTTHASPQCLSACDYMTVVLCGLIDGRPRASWIRWTSPRSSRSNTTAGGTKPQRE
jgi:ADP-ribosylglycohydrolase